MFVPSRHRALLIFGTVLLLGLLACGRTRTGTEDGRPGSNRLAAKETQRWSIQVDPGEYLLFRRASLSNESYELAAVKLDPPQADGSVAYECAFRDDGKEDLAAAPRTTGVLRERLSKSHTPGVFSTGESALDIVCGTFRAMWSAGNWVYFVDTNGFAKRPIIPADYDIAVPGETDLEQVKASDPNLTWHRHARAEHGS